MATLLLEPAPALHEGLEHDPHRWLGGAAITGQADAHGRLTLDDLIASVWEGLAVRATVSCPVCSGPMVSDVASGSEPGGLAGTCFGCGTRLS